MFALRPAVFKLNVHKFTGLVLGIIIEVFDFSINITIIVNLKFSKKKSETQNFKNPQRNSVRAIRGTFQYKFEKRWLRFVGVAFLIFTLLGSHVNEKETKHIYIVQLVKCGVFLNKKNVRAHGPGKATTKI